MDFLKWIIVIKLETTKTIKCIIQSVAITKLLEPIYQLQIVINISYYQRKLLLAAKDLCEWRLRQL